MVFNFYGLALMLNPATFIFLGKSVEIIVIDLTKRADRAISTYLNTGLLGDRHEAIVDLCVNSNDYT